MNNYLYIGWMCLCFGTLGGYFLGRDRASEDFYKKCQGGEVFMGDSGDKNPLRLVGCAEIARKIK